MIHAHTRSARPPLGSEESDALLAAGMITPGPATTASGRGGRCLLAVFSSLRAGGYQLRRRRGISCIPGRVVNEKISCEDTGFDLESAGITAVLHAQKCLQPWL